MQSKIYRATIDRPLGSAHPNHPDLIYTVNYGYIGGIIAPDGEEQDVYVLGVSEPIKTFTGKLVAIIHRKNDVEDKWILCPENYYPTIDEIREKTYFQEKYFDIEIMIQ